MATTIFSATGCLRCKIVKRFLNSTGQSYTEFDALGEGAKIFKTFYKDNRRSIYRGPDGIAFPILSDGQIVRQGLPMVMGHLIAGSALKGFFKPGLLHGEWIDGIHVSGGNPTHGEEFINVLVFLKKQRLSLQVETNGLNASLLKKVLKQGLANRVIMEIKGPIELYGSLLQKTIDPEEIIESIALVAQFDEYYYYSTISPILRKKDNREEFSYITPDEIAETARLIQETTGNNLQPYRLKPFDPQILEDVRLQTLEVLPQNIFFKYRTMARKHLYKTEILKS